MKPAKIHNKVYPGSSPGIATKIGSMAELVNALSMLRKQTAT